WVVLASDCSHFYEHFEKERAFTTMFNVGEAIDGYRKLRALAQSPRHIIPGHDPLVMRRYPAACAQLDGIVARLDVDPKE
ncbi:MAG: N-acyl homoserine lactonase family protein, partial [Pollutimonas bauzanensis]